MGTFTLKNDNDTEQQAKDKTTVVKQQFSSKSAGKQ